MRGVAAVISVGAVGLPVVSAYAGQSGSKRQSKATATPQSKRSEVQLSRLNLSKLSNKLHNSPDERRKFLANPQRYANSVYEGRELDKKQLQDIENLFASGFCCAGCGC